MCWKSRTLSIIMNVTVVDFNTISFLTSVILLVVWKRPILLNYYLPFLAQEFIMSCKWDYDLQEGKQSE